MDHSDHARCPNCSSNMVYDIKLGALKCESCDSVFTVNEYEEILKNKKSKNADSFSRGAKVDDSDEFYDAENLKRSYICSSCGGQLTPGAVAATLTCPFCGNDIVFTDKYKTQRMPDFIVPFQADREDFIRIYREELKRRLFVPDDFITGAKLEKVKAWYIPFWLYDLTVKGSASYQVEDVKKHGKNSYKHQVYEGSAGGELTFSNIPQDGSREVDDRVSQRLEPFPVDHKRKFNFAYLSGLDAKIYNVDSNECITRVKVRARESMDRFLSSAHEHKYYRVTDRKYDMKPNGISYALMPLWNMEIQWKGSSFPFTMNGQTGKCVAKFPISWKKFYACILSSLWMLSCFLAWISTFEAFVRTKDSIKGVGLLCFGYCWLMSSFFPRYLFSRNLNSSISSSLFFIIGCYFIYLTYCGKIDWAYFLISFGLGLFTIIMVNVYVVYKEVKEQNMIELRTSCDNNITQKGTPTVYHHELAKTKSTGNTSSIINGKEWNPEL